MLRSTTPGAVALGSRSRNHETEQTMRDDTQRGGEADQAGEPDDRRTVEIPGGRDFPDTNIAADQRRQAHERGAGLGAGASVNRDNVDPQPDDDGRVRDSRGRRATATGSRWAATDLGRYRLRGENGKREGRDAGHGT
jgi:hypothetical protein